MTAPQLIQPTGFHLCLSSDWLVSAVSANLSDFLPATAEDALGRPITDLMSEDAIHDIRNRMALLRSEETIEHLLRISLTEGGKLLDLSIFRHGSGFGIDAEPSDGHGFGDATAIVDGMLARISLASDVGAIGNEAARQLRALTGFDRVLIIGGGELLGHALRPGQAEHEPATLDPDVAHLAITDRESQPVAILAQDRDRPPLSTLRIAREAEAILLDSLHARAALIVPLMRNGKPWGHVGCYHGAARHIGVERRSVAGLFARFISLQLEVAELRSR